jgi:hypothetical protein
MVEEIKAQIILFLWNLSHAIDFHISSITALQLGPKRSGF